MASTMKVTFAAGAELGMRCLTNIEYGIGLSGGSEPSSCTRVKGMALKWGARNPGQEPPLTHRTHSTTAARSSTKHLSVRSDHLHQPIHPVTTRRGVVEFVAGEVPALLLRPDNGVEVLPCRGLTDEHVVLRPLEVDFRRPGVRNGSAT